MLNNLIKGGELRPENFENDFEITLDTHGSIWQPFPYFLHQNRTIFSRRIWNIPGKSRDQNLKVALLKCLIVNILETLLLLLLPCDE